MKGIWISLLLLAACGDDGGTTTPDAAEDAPGPDALPMALASTLYLSFDGGMVTPGNDDAVANTSSVVTVAATLPPYLGNDPQRATKLAAITSQLMSILQPFKIDIVTARPAAGPYNTIIFTSAAPTAIGSNATGSAVVPPTCNNTESVIGFNFGRSVELPRDIAVRNTIAMFGVISGIPLTVTAGDCMCLACSNLPQACTIGGPGTTVTTAGGSCGFMGTVDETALFTARFGRR